MRTIGIDPSLRGTAFSVCEDGQHKYTVVFKTKNRKGAKDSTEKLMQRFEDQYFIYRKVKRELNKVKPDIIAIENYSFGGKSNLTSQAEVVGAIGIAITKFVEDNNKVKFVIIAPTSVKKFLTGKGTGKKNLMLKEVFRRYNFDVEDDNIADAFVISKMGDAVGHLLQYRRFPKEIDKQQRKVLLKISTVKILMKGIKR